MNTHKVIHKLQISGGECDKSEAITCVSNIVGQLSETFTGNAENFCL